MLPKKNRLTKKNDFDAVFRKGKSVKADFFICKTLKNNLQESRFGFVVSKKVSPKATARNKVKRRLQKAVFCILKEVGGSNDIVVITLPGIEKKEYLEIEKAVKDSFKKLKICSDL